MTNMASNVIQPPVSKRVGAIAAALAFAGSGLLVATSAGAATPSPAGGQYLSVCGTIDGNYMCGTQQWIDAAQTAATNVVNAVKANAPAIENNLCKQIQAVTFVSTTLLSFFPPADLVVYLTGTGIGLTAGGLTTYNGR